jgi:LytR cell envelope-related transcriptional attenuator
MSMLTPLGRGLPRAPKRRHGNRRLAVLVVIAFLLGAGAGGWWWLNRDSDTVRTTSRPVCPSVAPTPTPVPATAVTLNVYNGTDRRGLASSVAAELKKRGFKFGKVANDPLKRKVTGLAEVRSSTAGNAAARTVIGHVGTVVPVPDQRKDASVDLVLGAAFKTLRTPAEAAAAQKPTPVARPSGC